MEKKILMKKKYKTQLIELKLLKNQLKNGNA